MRDGTYLIGRAPEQAASRPVIRIDHPTVSERHAELCVLNGRYYLCDLGSRNGTWRRRKHGEERITDTAIDPDDDIRFGEVQLTVRDLLDTAPIPVSHSAGVR